MPLWRDKEGFYGFSTRHMIRRGGTAVLLVMFIGIMSLAGCAQRKAPPQPIAVESPPKPVEGITAAGYTVQVGAFSVPANAVRLTGYLNARGENAFYFRHASGLFKVRIGDFATREEALKKARQIVAQGLVDTYYIVSPEEYPLAQSKTRGSSVLREEIVKTAMGFIGLPYQWGGTSPKAGFDCSGLTMVSYRLNGLNLPRSSRAQFRKGVAVSKRNLQKGDLVFFSIKGGKKVSHVGVYKGEGEFVHAPGARKTIRVDSLSNPYFTRHYSGARSYF